MLNTLLGLHFTPAVADLLMPGIRNMRDSLTYQAILDEGRVEGRVDEARELLVELGTRRFGPLDGSTRRSVEAIGDYARLHALVARLFDAATWDDLLTGTS